MKRLLLLTVLFTSLADGYAFNRPIILHRYVKNGRRFSKNDDVQSNDFQMPSAEQLRDLPTDKILETILKYDVNSLTDEVKELIDSRAAEEAPNDLEIRMNILGINSLTIAGFILAAFMFTMNSLFGNGWLGDLLGMNAPNPAMSEATSVYNENNFSKIKELKGDTIIDYDQVLRDIEAYEYLPPTDGN